jgi:hypothetical protein
VDVEFKGKEMLTVRMEGIGTENFRENFKYTPQT